MSETEAINFLENFYDTVLNRHKMSSISKEAFIEDMKRESEAWGNGWEWYINKRFFALTGQTRPIRAKSCKFCKHFVEIPNKLSLGDEEQGYLRFCAQSGLHEPIDDTWELEHELCFVRKESGNAKD